MEESAGQAAVTDSIRALNENVKRQMSFPRTFVTGIVYGMGFVFGSSVVAVLLLGVAGPLIVRLFPIIGDIFNVGRTISG